MRCARWCLLSADPPTFNTSPREIDWAEFADSGFLWLVNHALHVFGLAIVMERDETTGAVSRVYPARVAYRGFNRAADERGYQRVTAYMRDNAADLLSEVLRDD